MRHHRHHRTRSLLALRAPPAAEPVVADLVVAATGGNKEEPAGEEDNAQDSDSHDTATNSHSNNGHNSSDAPSRHAPRVAGRDVMGHVVHRLQHPRPASALRVPTPTLVPSRPNSGTTTLHRYFPCGRGIGARAHHRHFTPKNGDQQRRSARGSAAPCGPTSTRAGRCCGRRPSSRVVRAVNPTAVTATARTTLSRTAWTTTGSRATSIFFRPAARPAPPRKQIAHPRCPGQRP